MEGSSGCHEIKTGKDVSSWSAHKAHIEFQSDDQSDSFILRVWHKGPTYMALVSEDGTAPSVGLKVGQRLNVRYSDNDPWSPCQYLDTVVRKISLRNEGQLNGCYLVEMDILH
jgi:hypothetical protein